MSSRTERALHAPLDTLEASWAYMVLGPARIVRTGRKLVHRLLAWCPALPMLFRFLASLCALACPTHSGPGRPYVNQRPPTTKAGATMEPQLAPTRPARPERDLRSPGAVSRRLLSARAYRSIRGQASAAMTGAFAAWALRMRELTTK